jgi:hypothetical protein
MLYFFDTAYLVCPTLVLDVCASFLANLYLSIYLSRGLGRALISLSIYLSVYDTIDSIRYSRCARLYSQCPWTTDLSREDIGVRGHWLIGCPSYGCPLSCCLARPGRPSYRWACEDHGAPQSRESSCLHDPARLSPGCSTRRISRGNHEAL